MNEVTQAIYNNIYREDPWSHSKCELDPWAP